MYIRSSSEVNVYSIKHQLKKELAELKALDLDFYDQGAGIFNGYKGTFRRGHNVEINTRACHINYKKFKLVNLSQFHSFYERVINFFGPEVCVWLDECIEKLGWKIVRRAEKIKIMDAYDNLIFLLRNKEHKRIEIELFYNHVYTIYYE